MLDRKQIREAIACPQLGDTTYGKWGILTVEQRLTIARLLDELEHTDDYLKRLWLKNQKQKEVIDRLNFIKNRKNQGASQENINKMAIEFVNSYLKEVSE